MVNASLPVYAKKKSCQTTRAGKQHIQQSLLGVDLVLRANWLQLNVIMKTIHSNGFTEENNWIVQLSLISCAIKAEYLPVKPASYMSVMNVKLFVPVICVPSTSANHPIVLNGNLKEKKACSNSAISRWLGAYVAACQQTWGHAAKSLLKGSLSKGAYFNVLVFLCSSAFHHMYTEAGARSHTSFFVCICLAVFIVLLVLCALLSLFHRCFSPLLPCYPTFLLCSHNRVVISSEITSCSWQFQDETLTHKMLWLANIVWAFLWVKLLRGSR